MKSLLRNKNARVSILIILVLAVIGLGFLVLKDGVNIKYNAELSLVNGRVEQSFKSGSWSELKSGDSVIQGALIRTGVDSRAIITLDDGSAVRIDADSEIQLVSLDPKNIVIKNNKGKVYTRVVKADRSFIVESGGESYKSLGTAYKTVNTSDEQGVYVYESKVKAEVAKTEVPMGSKFLTKSSDKSKVKKLLDISANEIAKDNFIQWNKDLDEKDEEFKKYLGILEEKIVKKVTVTKNNEPAEKNNETSDTTGTIYLSGSVVDGGILFNWSTTNLGAGSGFKLVKSSTAYPTYPGSSYVYLSDTNTRSYKWGITNGATYHFRVCRYIGGVCDVYSNDIVVKAPYVAEYKQAKVSWSVNETEKTITMGSSYSILVTEPTTSWPANGFKLVWSKTSSPTYPTRSSDRYQYYSSASQRNGVVYDFDGAGTYYVRVCEYFDGACGVYSNQITVTL